MQSFRDQRHRLLRKNSPETFDPFGVAWRLYNVYYKHVIPSGSDIVHYVLQRITRADVSALKGARIYDIRIGSKFSKHSEEIQLHRSFSLPQNVFLTSKGSKVYIEKYTNGPSSYRCGYFGR